MANTFTIHDAECLRATDKAILVEAPDLDEDVWIPKSQIDDNSEVYDSGHTGVLIVNRWFAQQRGWV